MPILTYQTVNGMNAFPIMANLDEEIFDNCPKMVRRDSIRMWREVNGNLLGISLTTLTFSDGFVDYKPWVMGPKFAIPDSIIKLSRPHDEHLNRCFSSFVYLPETFRSIERDTQVILSTDKFCRSHHGQIDNEKDDDESSLEHLRAHCIPQPDRLNTLHKTDDLYAKVPCTNASL